VSVEEPAASEEAKDNEVKKKADEEEQKETDDKEEDEGAEESKLETMDTSVPDEIKKEESSDGKLECCDMYHVSFQVYMKACSLVSLLCPNMNIQLKETVTITQWPYFDALTEFNEKGKHLVEVTFLIQCIISIQK
jgi:hypothetical protein